MKKLLLLLALLLSPSAAWAQCTGVFAAGSVCGTTTLGVPHQVPFTSVGITALTGDVTATGPGSVAATLATVNANVGAFGSATQCVAFTVNAKGLVTAASAVTCTPAVGSITGLGTGVATALGVALNGSGGVLAPTPTTAGDIAYWNGTTWTKLTGNTVGTQVLSESSLGVPAWTTASTGTVTSVTCGTGLSGGTITASGTCAVSLSTVTNSLGADVGLTNIANYFDGPSVAQGTTGTWFASGTVTVRDTGGAADIDCKLWDGTTVIASTSNNTTAANVQRSESLSGYLATPAGNIRISCRDKTATTGAILFNFTGNSKDSTISVLRIN